MRGGWKSKEFRQEIFYVDCITTLLSRFSFLNLSQGSFTRHSGHISGQQHVWARWRITPFFRAGLCWF